MAMITAFKGFDLLSLSDDNFWYMGSLARNARGSSHIAGDTSFNQSLGGRVLRFEGEFGPAQDDGVTSVSVLDASGQIAFTLRFPEGTLESDLRYLEGRSDQESFGALMGRRDIITLSQQDDVVSGFYGNDLIRGLGGDDSLLGDYGKDRILGGSGRDTLSGGYGDDDLQGGAGRDQLSGGYGDDLLSGGGLRDDLAGDEGDDTLFGDAGNDRLDGGPGADMLFGGQRRDRLQGGAGRDRLDGGAGDDILKGGGGADVFVFSGETGDDTIRGFGRGDRLAFSAELWDDPVTQADILSRHASLGQAGVVIHFETGGSVLVEGLTDPGLLSGSIDLG